MMSDLIERLRRYSCQSDDPTAFVAELIKDLHDAADRIEELEAQVHSNQASSMRSAKAAERLQEKLDVAEACIEELEAENERLWEATQDYLDVSRLISYGGKYQDIQTRLEQILAALEDSDG
jgi:chromosome segregation ATPase